MEKHMALALVALILALAQPLIPPATAMGAQQFSFTIAGYEFTSTARGPVYPGSQGARLTVEAEYYGLKAAENVHACLELPEGFQAQQVCVEARNQDGALNTSVAYGSIRYFYYTIDVDRSVKPGTYRAVLEIRYTVDNTARRDRFPLTLRVSPYPEPELRILDVWVEPYSYPGTLGATIRIRVQNTGEASIAGGQAHVLLPEGFKPREYRLDVPQIGAETGEATISIGNVFISPLLGPGKYRAVVELSLTMTTEDGVEYHAEATLRPAITVEEPPTPLLTVSHVAWSQGVVYPGARGATLEAYIAVLEDYTVSDIEAWLLLPEGFTGPNGSRIVYAETSPQQGYGGVFRLSFPGIDLGEKLEPGNYTAKLSVLLHLSGRGAETLLWYNTSIPIVVESDKGEELRLVDYGWTTSPVSPGTVGAEAYASLQYLGSHTVTSVKAVLHLVGARTRANTSTITVYSGGLAAGRGTVFTLRFPGIVLAPNSSQLQAVLEVEAVVELPGGATAIVERNYTLRIPTAREKPLVLLESHVEYNNAPAHVLPGAAGLALQVTLLNTMPTSIAYINYSITTPPEIRVLQATGTCGGGVAAGSTCTLTIVFNTTSTARPGEYSVRLGLHYAYSLGNTYTSGEEEITIPLIVENPEDYAASPLLVAWHWGTPNAPSPIAYTGAPAQQLTIVVYNPSRWQTTLTATLGVQDTSVSIVDPVDQCSLGPTGLCQLVFTIDTSRARAGRIPLRLLLDYTVDRYGSFTILEKQYTINAVLKSIEDQGIVLLKNYWQDNNMVFPGSRRAVLVVVLENREPWTLQGVDIELEPPPGVRESYPGSLAAHVDGPIAPLSSMTVTLQLDVDNNTLPGNYTGVLRVAYWYTSGGIIVEKHTTLPITLVVESARGLLDYLGIQWGHGAPKPGDRGAQFTVVFRANKPSQVNNPYLELHLPSGISDAYTGAQVVRRGPSQAIPLAPGAPSPTSITGLQELLGNTATQAIGPGLLYFTFRVNIAQSLEPGNYTVKGFLDFLDSWGTPHRVPVEILLPIPGGTGALVVSSEPYTTLVNGTTYLEVRVYNNGTGPVYNIYLFLIPQSPNAYPVKPIAYIPALESRREETIRYPLVYSPKSPYGGETGYTFAGILGIIYQDSSGTLYRFNTTVSAIIKPPVRLVFTEAKAEYMGGVTRVSVSIANLGPMKAERTILEAEAGGRRAWSLVGEIDPGDEMPAKVEIKGPNPGSITVRVIYYDEYDNRYTYEQVIPVVEKQSAQASPAKPSSGEPVPGGQLGLVATAAVIVFLVAAFAAIYRYLRGHRETVPQLPEEL